MTESFHLDWETRSELELDEVGLARYMDSPTTSIIMANYARGDRKIKTWEPHKQSQIPAELEDALLDPFTEVHAFNAAFEYLASWKLLGIHKPIEEFRCVMAKARYLSLPGSLSGAGKVLGLSENEAKDAAGKRLIRKFCIPESLGGEDGLFGVSAAAYRDWNTDPEDWQLFCDYGRQDVVAERALEKKLDKFPMPESEWETWFLSEKINSRGLPVDMTLVAGARGIVDREMQRLTAQLRELTSLENPNSTSQLLPWLAANGYTFTSLGKAFVARAMGGECDLTDAAREALLIRGQTSKSSIKKYTAIADTVSEDGRLRHQYTYYGAARTGRFSALGVNVGNLPRPTKQVEKKMDLAIELVRKADYDGIIREFGKPLEVVSSTLRSSFRAPEGKKLIVVDLNAIEARGLAVLARCEPMLNVFVKGLDPYIEFATRMYGGTYEELYHEWKVLGNSTKRTNAKPPVLGCLGDGTLVLTGRGWLPIIFVRITDRVWDGVEWVRQGGVVYQGIKEVIELGNVKVTPDHRVLTEEGWKTACEVMQNGPHARSAIGLATGLLPDRCNLSTKNGSTPAGVNRAGQRNLSIGVTWRRARQNRVFCARTSASTPSRVACTRRSRSTRMISWTGLRIGTTQFSPGAGAKARLRTDTRGAASHASSPASRISWGTALPSRTTTNKNIKWTAGTTTGTMPEAIFASFPPVPTTATKRYSNTSSGKANGCAQRSSGSGSAHNIDSRALSVENFAKVSLWSRSSQNKPTAEVPTYDILNAGPRNRFMILTNGGPLLVHNCGYGLGPGEERLDEDGNKVWTGLMGYSRALGVEMSREDAAYAIQIFRESYPEVKRLWRDMHDAAARAIKNPGQVVGVGVPQTERDIEYFASIGRAVLPPIASFRCTGKTVLEMILPSGRSLHYINPTAYEEEATYKDPKTGRERKYMRTVVQYDGKEQGSQVWGPIPSHGGKWTENLDQAICRDILVNGMKKAEARGFEIVLHTYDEIGALVDIDSDLGVEELRECMTSTIDWCGGEFPLAAEGFESVYYKK